MQSDALSLRQALLKSHETRSAVAAILEQLPDMQGLEVEGEQGPTPFSSERLGASIASAMKLGGEHDEGALAYVTYRVLLSLQPLRGQRPLASSEISESVTSALVSARLLGSADAYNRRHLPQSTTPRRGMVFEVSVGLPAGQLSQDRYRMVSSLCQWAKEDGVFATADDLGRFETALSALISNGIALWDERSWARLAGVPLPALQPLRRLPELVVPPEFIHALGEGRPGMLLERVTKAVENGGTEVRFEGAERRWHTTPYIWPAERPAMPVSFVAIDLAKLLPLDGSLAGLPAVAETLLIAQDVLLARLPHADAVARRASEEFRPVAIGLTGIEAFLLSHAAAPESAEAVQLCAGLTSLLAASLHTASAKMAEAAGPFACWKLNERPCLRVVGLRRDAGLALAESGTAAPLVERAKRLWEAAFSSSISHGLRHSQLACLVPVAALAKLSDGSSAHGVTLLSVPTSQQLALMEACQPFVSGAPLSAVTLAAQPKSVGDALLAAGRGGAVRLHLVPTAAPAPAPAIVHIAVEAAVPEAAPAPSQPSPAPAVTGNREQPAVFHTFSVSGVMATLMVTLGSAGNPAAISLSLHKPGSTTFGLCAVFSEAVSLALAAGVPLSQLAERFTDVGFAPHGTTDNPDIATATSVVDYAFRWLMKRFPEAAS